MATRMNGTMLGPPVMTNAVTAPPIPPYQAQPPLTSTPPKIDPFTGAPPAAAPVVPFTGAAPTATPYGTFTGTAPTATPYGAFTGTAPTATPYGTFTAPDPTSFKTDPSYEWRLSQGLKGLERSAARRGTLLTGGLLKAEQDYGQNAASQEYGNAYQRALSAYGTNRDTNAQNYGQNLNSYQAELARYNTNRDTNSQNFGQAQTRYQDDVTGYNTNRDTNAQNFGQARGSYADTLAGYKTNADTAAQNFAQDQQRFQDALSAHKTNTDTALSVYDRNTAAGDKSQDWAAAEAIRQHDAQDAMTSEFERQRMAHEQQLREESDRINAANSAVKPARPYPYLNYPTNARGAVGVGR